MAKNPTPARSTRTRPSAPIASTPTDGRHSSGTSRAIPKLELRIRNSRFEPHRVIASVALVLLLVLSIIGPAVPTPPDPAALLTPRIDGSGSVTPALGIEGQRAIFTYLPEAERSLGNLQSVWPNIETILKYDADDLLVRRAIIGQIYASSTGNLDQTISATGLTANPTIETIEGIEELYNGLIGGDTSVRGVNGLAAMRLVRSLTANDEQRRLYEDQAITTFARAVSEDSETWQFLYNWSLANLLVGNYADAREGMSRIFDQAANSQVTNVLPRFWAGLAALRNGDPAEAIGFLTPAIELQAPEGGNQAFRDLYERASALSREALAGAHWANRDPARAYEMYLDVLRLGGNNSTTPYVNLLRLGTDQRIYEKLIADLGTLLPVERLQNIRARIHHDRARLLTMLGRTDEALSDFKRAAELSDDDASTLIAHGQALQVRGDLGGALVKSQEAITRLGLDPRSADLTRVARAAFTTTTQIREREEAQQLLDANLLRASVFGRQGRHGDVRTLAQNITAPATQLPPEQAGLLHLYAAFAYEAAGMNAEAMESYTTAWDSLKGSPPPLTIFTQQKAGRAAALAGLARTSAALNGPQAGINALKTNGYDPVQINGNVASDPDAPEILYQGSLLLDAAGQRREAANALRVSAITYNLKDVREVSGIGRPIWSDNGTLTPAGIALQSADVLREVGGEGDNTRVAALRYRQAFGLAPALAPAWNNLGTLYAERGLTDRARVYLQGVGHISPNYALGQHNLAAFAYKQGLGNYFVAEGAQGDAIKASGARSLNWGYNLRYDERGPTTSQAAPASDFLARLPAIFVLALLLLHTLVPHDKVVNRALVPGEGPVGKLANGVDAQMSAALPSFFTSERGSNALLRSLIIPALVGMLGLAWGAARGSLDVAVIFLPVALLSALGAFGANEVAQYLAARRAGRETLHNNWPTGLLLGLVSIPFGAPYGWQVTTRLTPSPSIKGRARAGDGHVGEYVEELEPATVPSGIGRLGLSSGSRILFAGLLANLALALLFGLVYWLTGWPSVRLALFATLLVLAFTSVSEAPADGWPVHRRNPALWLALFVAAATGATLLAGGFI